jgi:hypothetical protein
MAELIKQNEMKNCYFKPNINPVSSLIVERLRQIEPSGIKVSRSQ